MTLEDKVGVLSMTALDLDEVKAYVARKDLAYALLAAQCEERICEKNSEKEMLKHKLSQMEMLLKGRQSALMAKEQECANLRSLSCRRPPQCVVFSFKVFSQDQSHSPTTPAAWLSVSSRMTSIIPGPTRSETYVQTEAEKNRKEDSPPPTVYRKDRRVVSSSSSSESPKQTRVRRSLEKYRDSFASVRSSLGVKSVSDDSDASLDELVSNAMRLSRTSRSSTGSSVVRGSVRESLQSVFPKRWK